MQVVHWFTAREQVRHSVALLGDYSCVDRARVSRLGAADADVSCNFLHEFSSLMPKMPKKTVMMRCNFLHEFSSLMPKKPKKTAMMRVRETVWLDLLISLSFSTDGQNIILKVNDALALLVEFGSSSFEHYQKSAVLVLRNLCFNTAGKSKLLATANLLPFLLHCVERGSKQVRLISCSALWALVYNCHKAKVNLKNAHVVSKLQEAYSQLVNVPDSPWAEKCAQNLHDVLVVLRS